jgi:hypothetical protein
MNINVSIIKLNNLNKVLHQIENISSDDRSRINRIIDDIHTDLINIDRGNREYAKQLHSMANELSNNLV